MPSEDKKKETMLERNSKTHADRVAIMEFLEWIGSKGIDLCIIPKQYEDCFNPHWCPISKTKDTLLNEFFEIDATQLEKERRELLASIQTMNKVAKADGSH